MHTRTVFMYRFLAGVCLLATGFKDCTMVFAGLEYSEFPEGDSLAKNKSLAFLKTQHKSLAFICGIQKNPNGPRKNLAFLGPP